MKSEGGEPVRLTARLEVSRISTEELLGLGKGSVIGLDTLAGESVDLLVNEQLVAQGAVVAVGDGHGVRIGNIVATEDRRAAASAFLDRHRGHLRALFDILNVPWHDDVAQLAATTARHWLGPEHGRIPADYTPAQRTRALALVDAMGLLSETLPVAGATFDETEIVAGTWKANDGRLHLVRRLRRERDCVLGPIKVWCGQRLREARDGTVDDIVDRLVARDPKLLEHPWVRAELARDPVDPDPWGRPFATEYEIVIANAMAVFGGELTFAATCPATGPATVAGVPRRTVLWQRFGTPDGMDLFVLNAAARHRPQGPARPTTASCAEEWLRHLPPAIGAQVLVVAGNPHTERTVGDVARVVRTARRGDLTIHSAGTPALEQPRRLELCLGEIHRLLHNHVGE
ncbi:FliM/FliN family flagellar motor switch protein [Nocardia arthritidis]|uniref:Flagellar motor switch protein FliN-like C-terminal domain-containing protein n=1 Tax=Nocardia arthritidis TaxID=228602 RepID=A0A6G9YM53_9NOCA|nr:FliM/FliN family flagellar motor switch protein [Nocardia arthritidis]QIS14003.1 hypothetical protein F5544_30800 [Nocardia arthritidis]